MVVVAIAATSLFMSIFLASFRLMRHRLSGHDGRAFDAVTRRRALIFSGSLASGATLSVATVYMTTRSDGQNWAIGALLINARP